MARDRHRFFDSSALAKALVAQVVVEAPNALAGGDDPRTMARRAILCNRRCFYNSIPNREYISRSCAAVDLDSDLVMEVADEGY